MKKKEVAEEAPGAENESTSQSGPVTRRTVLQAGLLLATGKAAAAPPPAQRGAGAAAQAREALKRGAQYLQSTQESDGSWQHYPGITALAVMALVAAEGKSHAAVP